MNKDLSKIKLIIGLGNKDKTYENTYHNVGHLLVDFVDKNQESRIKNQELLKSDGYMNNVGSFVSQTVKKTGLQPEKLLIVHDDSDIEIGNYKFSFGSGSAGHRGVESIIKSLKTKNFWRLRIGIRPPRDSLFSKLRPRKKASEFVLKKISKRNGEIFQSVFEKINQELSDLKNRENPVL
jgi:peptidyl-tRNA hydrolase, PTH1 family